MQEKLPISFYFKLIVIILVFGFAYYWRGPFIIETIQDDSLTYGQQGRMIFRSLLGMYPSQTSPVLPNLSSKIVGHPGNSQPVVIDEEIKSLEAYQHAEEKASFFNKSIDIDQLNQAYLEQLAQSSQGKKNIEVGYHLKDGNLSRAKELGEYHYLGPMTVDGESFRTQFPLIENSDYRLGENLYELFIAADDIHLKTWGEHPEVFAHYLIDAFQDSLDQEAYQNYQSQFISAYAQATDYQIDDAPYVRMVVVLNLDTDGLGGS
ncbi:hypothetical protein HZY91_06895 [Facklamia sp. DSM 111018]|uniref:Regulatory protein YycH-like domain-containing protein n=1 Tax=Facklamia lactis TaxID=2749967 RepID=A0ABS0LR33_9LACT|nr:hypothetical protein [Facklamia lactis]MBG9981017.1 hypothetical protein [Facklamia lactis]MBG9986620.1 hypothetical protein [Facklamia lactis]